MYIDIGNLVKPIWTGEHYNYYWKHKYLCYVEREDVTESYLEFVNEIFPGDVGHGLNKNL